MVQGECVTELPGLGDPRSKSGVHNSCVALSVSRGWEGSTPTHSPTQREGFAPLIQAWPPGFTAADVGQEPHTLSRHLGKVFPLKVVTQTVSPEYIP